MDERAWEFWIDVGGTFTDCVARRPDGVTLRQKVLSSGVIKGVIATESDARCVIDRARRGEPDDLWAGSRIFIFDEYGDNISEANVEQFVSATGALRLESPERRDVACARRYEIHPNEEAPITAIRQLMGLSRRATIPPVDVRLATTRATNALLTRSGAKTAFVTTRGFGDVLEIGYQARPKIFDLAIQKNPPLAACVVEIDERVTHDGEELVAPNVDAIRVDLERVLREGCASLAICLMHADLFPAHEELVAAVAADMGFQEVSVSHKVAPFAKIVPRGDTTVVDAYLNPVLRSYVANLQASLPDSSIRLLTSAGALAPADHFRGHESILSGPAGGVVAAAHVAAANGFERCIGFDMGGTSTDVSRYEGRFEIEFETEKAGVRIFSPTMAIETVAAGGGSICRFDGVKLVVGPESAGADPGPACYGSGGPLTVTDVNLFLGKLCDARFPFPLDRRAVETRLDALINEVKTGAAISYSREAIAHGLLDIANANMAAAIRSVSVAKGVDPKDFALVAFGGAAAQHACAIAEELQMDRILIDADAGVLSAIGVGLAVETRVESMAIRRLLSDVGLDAVDASFSELTAAARKKAPVSDGFQVDVTRSLDLCYAGVEHALTILEPEECDWKSAFESAHRKRFGYVFEDRAIEIVTARVVVKFTPDEASLTSSGRRAASLDPPITDSAPSIAAARRVLFKCGPLETRVIAVESLNHGDIIDGPAMIADPFATTLIDPGWRGQMLASGALLLSKSVKTLIKKPSPDVTAGGERDPVRLEILNNQLTAIADRMGVTLRNTATSVNVKERLDYSCAIFTATGGLVANAPHMPVHLGAMSETVRCVLADNPAMAPGDVYLTNNPFRGGSHLPDLTVVTPVFNPESNDLLFFTASRAHHAEIGGVSPGSMPATSSTLAEEGVFLSGFQLVKGGVSREAELRARLLDGPYPSRAVADNIADVAAQVAANRRGAEELLALVARDSWPVVSAYMRHVQDAAAEKTRRALSMFEPGRREFVDYIETRDGASIPIAVAITIHDQTLRPGPSATIDFTGSADVVVGNLNANRAIVTAAVIYCLRLLIDDDIPLNDGVLDPIELIIPRGVLDPVSPERAYADPSELPAVAGGNVETSQRLVDVILGAFGVAAASSGTMNNLIFGDATFGYYETICGGAGATSDHNGADAVQTHMTNTRLTDPEILERRYPIRVHAFAIRRGSGGAGLRRGGNGVVRELEFLRPLSVSILSQRRGPHPPYGIHGGRHGALGENILTGVDGARRALPGICTLEVVTGERIRIETPGGGGWGD